MAEERQFNVYLSTSLIRRVRIAALSRGASLSASVESALTGWLERLDREGDDSHVDIDDHGDHVFGPTTDVATKLSLVLKIYVSDMGRSIQFYKAIGATIEFRGDRWSIMRLGGAMLALRIRINEYDSDLHLELGDDSSLTSLT